MPDWQPARQNELVHVQLVACVAQRDGGYTLADVTASCPVHNGALEDLAIIAIHNHLLWLDVPVAVPPGMDPCQLLQGTQSLHQCSAHQTLIL